MNSQRGFTLAELLSVIAVLGLITATAIPSLLSFLEAQQTRVAAQQVATLLNQARQLAIATNTSYRVEVDVAGNRLRVVRSSDNAPWTGPGTDTQGYRTLENQARLVAATQNPTFDPLGAAGGSTITTQNARGSSSLSVAVSTSGRIRIQ